jgi:ribosomal protein S18 acetylase RimI-like enzyme
LIQATVQALRAQRFTALSLTVTAANQRAVGLYASLGFTQIKTFTAGVWKSPEPPSRRNLFS